MSRKQQLLQQLKQADGCISGEVLGRQLGISRMAVCKLIRSLKQDGYRIETAPNRGYLLHPGGDVLESEELCAQLHTRWLGHPLEIVDSLPSTNAYLAQLPPAALSHGRTILARRQTAGRGRCGSSFCSPMEKGIYMSFCLRPSVQLPQVKLFSLLAGLVVCRLARQCGVEQAHIRYPANVWAKGKKLCGIRCEVLAEAETMQVEHCIIGIGLYVNAGAEDFPAATPCTSLLEETGQEHQRSRLAAAILQEYEQAYETLLQHGSTALCREYASYLEEMGQRIDTRRHGSVTICNVDIHGQLVGRDSRNRVVHLHINELEQKGE